MEPNLRVFAYHGQPVLVLQQAELDYTLLRPDSSVTLGLGPFSQLPVGSYQSVSELLKMGLFLPAEVQGYQVQSARLLEEVAASGFQLDSTEDVLRVRLLPLLLMLDSVKRTLAPEYERAVGVVISAYFKQLTPTNTRLRACLNDMGPALNHILSRGKEECPKRIIVEMLTAGILQDFMTIAQWLEVRELVKINIDKFKSEVGPVQEVCDRLMERFTRSEEDFDLLRIAHTFATEAQKPRVVTTALNIVDVHVKSKLTEPQQNLMKNLMLESTDLLLEANLPLKQLLADTVTKEGAQWVVVRQVATGLREIESYRSEIEDSTFMSCFSAKGLQEIINSGKWKAIMSLKNIRNIDTLLEQQLSLLLEVRAPMGVLAFTNLRNSVKSIESARISIVEKGAALDICLNFKKWLDRDVKAVNSDINVIRKVTVVFSVLFVKNRSKFVRLPVLLCKEVILDYLVS